jgi:hypothetical protein
MRLFYPSAKNFTTRLFICCEKAYHIKNNLNELESGMSALKGIKAILKAIEGRVKDRYIDHPHAPSVNWAEVTIDTGVSVTFKGPGLGNIEFDDKLLLQDFGEAFQAFEAAADMIRQDLSAGAFPFTILFRPHIYLGSSSVKVEASDVVLRAYGASQGYSADMSRSLLRIKDCMDVLDRNCPETMDKDAYLVTQKSRADFPEYASKIVYASSLRAAENKAMIMHIPHCALDVIDGRPHHMHDTDIATLDYITVSLVPPTLHYRTSEPALEEGPSV